LTIKMSILHLYISIFGQSSPQFRLLVWSVMGVCMVSTTIFVIQILVLCRPIAFFWDKSIAGKCGSLNLTYLIPGIIITIEDIVVFTLPMALLWKLQMATSKKIGASIIFGVGLGICVISGVRLKYVIDLDTNDFTASISMFAILGTLEPMLGIISACMPVVPAITRHYSKNRLMAWSQKSGSGTVIKMSTTSATKGDLLSHSQQHSEFERLSDHEYPLISPLTSSAQVQSKVVGGDWSEQAGRLETGPITVERNYTVESQLSPGRRK
jgi:hypothetical protein